MSRQRFWEFKNRRQQHKFIVAQEQYFKFNLRHMRNVTRHSKKRWRKAEDFYNREWVLKQRANKWIM